MDTSTPDDSLGGSRGFIQIGTGSVGQMLNGVVNNLGSENVTGQGAGGTLGGDLKIAMSNAPAGLTSLMKSNWQFGGVGGAPNQNTVFNDLRNKATSALRNQNVF